MKKTLSNLCALLVLVALGFGVTRWLALGAEDAAPARARAIPVEVMPLVMESSIEVERRFTGTLVARRSTELGFDGSGRVNEILVDEGTPVTKGQTLARLDTSLLAARRAEIESRKTRLEAELAALVAGPRGESISAAQADVRALEERLAIGVVLRDRRELLVGKGTIGTEQLDMARAEVSTIEAELSAGEARLAELTNGTREETLAAQRGAIGEVDAALAAIDLSIELSTLKAPYSGTIAARMVDEGAMVSEMLPRAAFRLVESGALEARVGVPPDLAADLAAEVSGAQLEVRGKHIDVFSRVALPTVQRGTRTVTVIFRIDPASEHVKELRPGDIATMTVTLREPESGAWVPLSALSESTRGLWSLYRVVKADNGESRTERVEVEVLHVRDGRAFVRGTVAPGALIIKSGAHRLVSGQSVDPLAPGATAP